MADSANAKYGVDATLEGYTIESYSITEAPRREEVPDQHNAVVKEVRYDTRYDLRLTVRGASKPASNSITFDGKTYLVDSVEEAGSYNSLLRFNISGHCYEGCSSETSV